MGRFGDARRRLASAQKTSKGVSLYSRLVNRPVGRVFAAAAHQLRMTPDQVTLTSAVASFAGVALVAWHSPTPALGVVVWLLLAVGFAADSADGQLARLTGRGSAAGEWLDHVVDCAKTLALHMAVLVSFYRFPVARGARWLLLPVVFQFAAVLVFFAGVLTEQLTRHATGRAPEGRPSWLRAVALLPVDQGVVCAVFLFLGHGTVFVAAYGVLLVAHVLFLVAFLGKWYRQLASFT